MPNKNHRNTHRKNEKKRAGLCKDINGLDICPYENWTANDSSTCTWKDAYQQNWPGLLQSSPGAPRMQCCLTGTAQTCPPTCPTNSKALSLNQKCTTASDQQPCIKSQNGYAPGAVCTVQIKGQGSVPGTINNFSNACCYQSPKPG